MEIVAASPSRHLSNARCLWVLAIHEVGHELGRDIENRIHAEPIDPSFFDPMGVGIAQSPFHHGVFGIDVIKAAQLEIQLLVPFGEVIDIRRPVIDPRFAVGLAPGVI